MKLLHTSDWHIGKVLKGRPRTEDQVAALAAVVEIARALSALRATGAAVVAIAGNHDNGDALHALRPWADSAGIELRGSLRHGAADLSIAGRTATGEPWQLAALPFVSQRYAVRAAEMFELTAAEATQTYADHIGRLLDRLCEPFDADPDTINLVTAHLTVIGAQTGGGEREAHTIMGYAVPAAIFPGTAHYVALGHLHRAQTVAGPCPIRYSGSPLAVDFGETDNAASVSIVELSAGSAARVTPVPISAGAPLRTVHGTLAELATLDTGDAWLRVIVAEPPRAGLREQVQELLPRALEVRVDPRLLPDPASAARTASTRSGRSPGELFSDYLTTRGHVDEATVALFHRLHDELLTEPS